jgi:hypothetical protein
MYTWPSYLAEVWTILTLGKQPRLCDWERIANAPDIIAWLAIMAAATATTNVGQYIGSACHLTYELITQATQL